MKKILLIPTILATAVTPVIALASCGGQQVEEPQFSVDSSTAMENEKKAVITLDWQPTDHSIICANFKFNYGEGKEASVTAGQQGSRPLALTLNFSEEIYSDITNGALMFHYADTTAKLEKDAEVKNISIHKFEPEKRYVIDTKEISRYAELTSSEKFAIEQSKRYYFSIDMSILESLKSTTWQYWDLGLCSDKVSSTVSHDDSIILVNNQPLNSDLYGAHNGYIRINQEGTQQLLAATSIAGYVYVTPSSEVGNDFYFDITALPQE